MRHCCEWAIIDMINDKRSSMPAAIAAASLWGGAGCCLDLQCVTPWVIRRVPVSWFCSD
jgi:hypothetical protein